MDRARKIAAYWNWLPTFRAAAETEHLGQAAASLGISKPAVSRTVTQLEEELGVELLAREGRGVRLTEAGRLLQSAVRDAMRTVHEASLRFERSGYLGTLRVAVASPLSRSLLNPAVRLLSERHPGLKIETCSHDAKDLRSALLRGELDAALVRAEVRPVGINVERLGTLSVRAYAPSCMGLSSKRRNSLEELAQRSFIALNSTYGEDPFPASIKRRIALTTETFEQAAEAALELRALVLLPDSIAQPLVKSGELTQLQTPAIRPVPIVVAWRTPLAIETSADVFVQAVREVSPFRTSRPQASA